MTHRPKVLRTVGWLLAAGAWVFAALSLWSYSPLDWPSHAVYPWPRPANWCGLFGGWTAYRLFAATGPGAWVLLAGGGLFVALQLAGRRVGDLWLRGVGLAVLCVAVAGVSHEYGSHSTGLPEGDGGVFGLAAAGYLRPHFGVAGTRLALLLGCLAGLLLVGDELVLLWPSKALDKAKQAGGELKRSAAKQRPVEVKVPSLSLPKLSIPALPALPRFKFTRGEPAADAPKVRKKRVVTVPEVEDDVAGDVPPVKAELSDEMLMDEATSDEQDDTDTADADADTDETPDAAAEAAGPADETDAAPPVERDLSKIKVKLPSTTRVKRTAPPPPELGEYELPQWDVLEDAETGFAEGQEAFVREKAAQLEAAFEEFGVDAQVVEIDTGPVITMYEINVARGTKVSAITGLSNDLARTLAAESIRVVAPIPGKNTIGIEVPNAEKEKVRLKELMQLAPEKTGKMAIPLYLGKNSSGEPLIADLAGMPHCLIAGTTGSGKSVCINTVIMSIMYTQRPDMVKLILVDPKVVEMAPFKDIPHLMCPVITDAAKATTVLGVVLHEDGRAVRAFGRGGRAEHRGLQQAHAGGADREVRADHAAGGGEDSEEAAVHGGHHRRAGGFDDDQRQGGGEPHRPHRAEGAGRRHPPDPGDAAAAGERGHGPHQKQHAQQNRLPRGEQDGQPHRAGPERGRRLARPGRHALPAAGREQAGAVAGHVHRRPRDPRSA